MFSDIRKLKIGEVYTLAAFTMSGIPYRLCFTLKSLRNISHGEYADAYHLKYIRYRIGGGYRRINVTRRQAIYHLVRTDVSKRQSGRFFLYERL